MKTRFFPLILLILASCAPAPTIEPSPVIPTSTTPSLTATIEPTIASDSTITPTPAPEFEIVGVEVLKDKDTFYIDYLRPGVNVKVVLSNLNLGMLPEEQLKASNFCAPCVGWDNAGVEGENEVVVVHFYSWDLKEGENTLAIRANGIEKQANFIFEPSTQTNSGDAVNPQGEFEIVGVEVLTKDNTNYPGLLRPGVNIKVMLSNLDTGLLPEDQLRAQNFCGKCSGWDNADFEDGFQVVILHFHSSALKTGENIIAITAYGVTKEVLIQFDPSIHLTP